MRKPRKLLVSEHFYHGMDVIVNEFKATFNLGTQELTHALVLMFYV